MRNKTYHTHQTQLHLRKQVKFWVVHRIRHLLCFLHILKNRKNIQLSGFPPRRNHIQHNCMGIIRDFPLALHGYNAEKEKQVPLLYSSHKQAKETEQFLKIRRVLLLNGQSAWALIDRIALRELHKYSFTLKAPKTPTLSFCHTTYTDGTTAGQSIQF